MTAATEGTSWKDGGETHASALVRFLRRGAPLRRLPVLARYAIATAIVLACFAVRYALGEAYPYPYLVFVLGVIFASFILDRGSGFVATGLSALLAVYFFVEPRYSFYLPELGQSLSVGLFVLVCLIAASIIEALRVAVEELAVTTQDLAASRRELGTNLGLLETVFECSPDPIFVKDREGRFQRLNAAAARIAGAPRRELIGRRAADLVPADQAQKLEELDARVLASQSPVTMEERLAGHDPQHSGRWFMTTKAPWYGPDGSLVGIVEITRDIHQRKEAEVAAQAANAQKDVLLHDINHRVKNHLQSIISTLAMSAREIEDGAAQAAIQSAMARLAVLARVYDRLRLRSEGEAVVSANEFITGLGSDLEPALIGLRPIALTVRAEPIPLELARAVPVGLIVNEALTNAIKYGFPDDAAGHVAVLFEERDGKLHLEVSDNGIGMTAEQRGRGVGTRLIRALAQQLGGTPDWHGPPGTTLVVQFPKQAADGAPL